MHLFDPPSLSSPLLSSLVTRHYEMTITHQRHHHDHSKKKNTQQHTATKKTHLSLSEQTWLSKNFFGFLMIIMSITVVLILIVYTCKRLWRYRAKYHEERASVEKMQQEVDDMEQYGTQASAQVRIRYTASARKLTQLYKIFRCQSPHAPLHHLQQDDQVRMSENPMVLQMKDMQAKLETKVNIHTVYIYCFFQCLCVYESITNQHQH